MKKATFIGFLMVFGLFLLLCLAQYDLGSNEVSLANLSAKTTHGPSGYRPLEPDTVTSLGLQAATMTQGDSLFTSTAFLYALVFVIILVTTFIFCLKKAAELEEAAWQDFQKSLSKSEKSLHEKE